MYRLVALLFALLLPLQFAWGAAASYCQHETTVETARHLGHHEHLHQAETEKSADAKPVVDNDCNACHASCSVVASEGTDSPAAPVAGRRPVCHATAAHASALARAPDRPQWLRLV